MVETRCLAQLSNSRASWLLLLLLFLLLRWLLFLQLLLLVNLLVVRDHWLIWIQSGNYNLFPVYGSISRERELRLAHWSLASLFLYLLELFGQVAMYLVDLVQRSVETFAEGKGVKWKWAIERRQLI